MEAHPSCGARGANYRSRENSDRDYPLGKVSRWADEEVLLGSHGDVQKNATVVAERLRNRENDLKRTFGLARKAERHLNADGKAIYDELVALYRVAQNVYNAASALTLRGRTSSDLDQLIRTAWSETGDDALGVEADCLAKSIETRVERWL